MHERSNFRGISLLSVVGKVYGRVLINRIRDKTENVIAEVQGGFKRGRGCTTGVFRLDRGGNEVVRARTGVRRELAARVDMNVLRWFGHVGRMDNE